MMEARSAESRGDVAPARPRSRPRSTASSGTPAGPTSSAQVLGGSNPVAGPYFNFTVPEPTGVVAIVAPDEPALLGLVSRVAPALAGRQRRRRRRLRAHPLAAIELAEVIATSDLPGGVVNLLTGQRAELAPVLASHMDVNAIDVTGADEEGVELEVLAADNVKRVVARAGATRAPGRSRRSWS